LPELPDLEIIKKVLRKRILGLPIVEVVVRQPLVLRCTLDALFKALIDESFNDISRRGKFLLFYTTSGYVVVTNPMLSGGFQLAKTNDRLIRDTCVIIRFENQKELRYFDHNRMGKIYLVQDDFSSIPKFVDMGPEANDTSWSLFDFHQRLKKHRGMVKNVLTNHKFIAGIGNAYADEILFEAGILPNRLAKTLNQDEIENLNNAILSVLTNALDILRVRIGERIELKVRDFLKVHNKGGQPCPKCGHPISEIRPNQRITSFCRGCQK